MKNIKPDDYKLSEINVMEDGGLITVGMLKILATPEGYDVSDIQDNVKFQGDTETLLYAKGYYQLCI